MLRVHVKGGSTVGKNTAKPVKIATILAVISIVAITVVGCSVLILVISDFNRPHGFPSKIEYYTTLWTDRGSVIEKPFRETTSDRGNDLFVGVVRNASRQSTTTISYEHVNSQSQAASVFQEIVTAAKNNGYKERPSNSTDPNTLPYADEYWLGVNNLTFSSKAIQYYQDFGLLIYVVEQQDF